MKSVFSKISGTSLLIFFHHGMEWPAFESVNGQDSTTILESKFLDTMQTLLAYFG